MKFRRAVAVLLAVLALVSAPGVMQVAVATDTTVSSATIKAYKVKVTADMLNIRKSASNTAKITGLLRKGNTVTIDAEKKDSRGVTWGRLSNGKGWINLSYTSKISSTSYTGKVQVPSLNVRKSADNTSKVVAVLSKGDKVTITGEKTDSRDIVWGKVKGKGGWINTDFIQTSKSASYKVKVTLSKANVREYASLGAKVNTTLSKNTVVQINAEQKDSRGITWVKLSNGKGWLSMEAAKKTTASTTSFKVKVTANSLTIRKSPKLTADITGYLKKNDVVTIVDTQKDSRGVTWGKLSNGKGWISFKYAKKV